MTNANEITFGVEIECYSSLQTGAAHIGRPVENFPTGWNAQADGSLGAGGTEIVSPVLKGQDGLTQIKDVCSKLAEMNARVSRKCGFHCHVGFNGSAAELERLVAIVANFEKALFAATGTKTREQSRYCRSIKTDYKNLQFGASIQSLGCAARDRYHLLNISNLIHGTKKTVEFRCFAGTLNAKKIIAYVRLCVAFVQRALEMSRKTNWDAKKPVETSPIFRKGEGATEMARLMYQFGWTKGRTKTVYGEIVADGLPTMKASKKELVKLAKKYDATR